MEQKILSKSPMVSRLPKFGARPVNGTPSPLPNGTTQTAPIQEVKSPPAKPNGFVRASSFSMKWRKESGGTVDPKSPDESRPPEEKRDIRSLHSPANRELKSPSVCSTKIHRSASSISTGSPKPVPKSIPSPKSKPQNSRITTTVNTQDLTQKISCSKATQNGTLPVGSTPGRMVSSGLQRPRANSGSHGSSSRDSLSHSNDSLSLQSIVPDYMVRSQSFTHFKQLPSPSNAPMIRSFSFNKAVELAKPLANTQLRTPRTFGLKSPQSLSKGKLALGFGGLRFRKGLSDQLPAAATSPDSFTPPNVIKRPLLSNSVLTKPSLQACRLNRTVAAKSQCSLLVGRTLIENDVITPPLTPELPHCPTKSASTHSDSPEEVLIEQGLDGNLQRKVEGTEDMSLSSASSLERNDTSEEFLDDFDNIGDQSQNGISHNKSLGVTSTQTRLQSFLTETMDWTGIGLGGGKADFRTGPTHGPSLTSPDGDCLAASSLELSPSNSSGGTYMWDEEGMEPLGHNKHMHCCSSYESDLNSIDILNNFDYTGSCDLEEDDLMLDVDLPEDGALRSDGMAHFERSERGGRPAHWRRRQQRWSGTDHAQNDNRLSGLHYDGCRTVHRPLHPSIQRDGHAAALDELVLKHMADDCTSVKSQLLKLHSLLQMDDGEITPEILDTSEDERKAQQMEEMMKEVAYLREELKKKDQIITQLTHHQQQESLVRCQCLHQKCGVKGERRTHHDKSTQTAWRPPHHHHTPQILQPISHIPNDSLIQGRVARTAPTGDRSDACPPRERTPVYHFPAPLTSVVPSPAPRMAEVPHKQSRSQPDPEELSQLLSTHLHIQDNRESDSQQNGEHIVRPTLHNRHNRVQSMSLSFFSPRVLQGPRLHRRFTLSALPQGVTTEANPKLAPNAMNAKQLPPPSRGLPCVNSGNRDRSLDVLSQPRPPVVRRETVPNLGGGSEAKPGSTLNHSAKPLPSSIQRFTVCQFSSQ
ncbi:serine-rich coiled-coil domain-containing protein 2 isoform X1 [Triplophysa dalaica]|uniref:serine-rich coiled-coil domain-containing protein 2 isoform X1 n=1 Tax=Triplophysa dalaica TaxID=1582913 RepID=UPI0024DF345A|nr:serine-rich coiled-coil domain-containing protein 2 isoform X1 [Triplophysa dalaica]